MHVLCRTYNVFNKFCDWIGLQKYVWYYSLCMNIARVCIMFVCILSSCVLYMYAYFQAVYARDALCKAIYNRLFSWLVQRINDSIKVKSEQKSKVMGVLDIYGFEVFEVSTLIVGCLWESSYGHWLMIACSSLLQVWALLGLDSFMWLSSPVRVWMVGGSAEITLGVAIVLGSSSTMKADFAKSPNQTKIVSK